MRKEPRIIFFDLETLPNLEEALKVWPQLSQYPGKTLRASITSIICAGWKEYGKKRVNCINAWDYKNWDKDVNDDYEVCKAIREVLDGADAVVTHNGKRFDWKYLQTRLLYHGFDPLHRINHVDTKALASSNLFVFNNKLGTIGQFLVGDNKLENGGWDLWVDVHKKKKSAMNLMARYCKQDVALLEKVFEKLKPLIKNLPNYNNFNMVDQMVCPNCGSGKFHGHGMKHTKTRSYRRYLCQDCGTVFGSNAKGNIGVTI